jgi:hypothetical protein
MPASKFSGLHAFVGSPMVPDDLTVLTQKSRLVQAPISGTAYQQTSFPSTPSGSCLAFHLISASLSERPQRQAAYSVQYNALSGLILIM